MLFYTLVRRRAPFPRAGMHTSRVLASGFGFFKHSAWGAPKASEPEEQPAQAKEPPVPAPAPLSAPAQAREAPKPASAHARGPAVQPRSRAATGDPRETGKAAKPSGGTGVPRGKDLARSRLMDKISRRVDRQREKEGGPQRAARDEEIQAATVALVGEDGTPLGNRPLREVLDGMDREQHTLLMVDPHQQPPVCRLFQRKIMYDREKRARKVKAAQHRTTKVHTIRLRDTIDAHDLDIKCDRLAAFLAKGQRVTVTIQGTRGGGPERRRLVGERI
ncbi:hypothetical protein IWQ56_001282, partial [Coemansia nantahalensis]